jgi:hypothetical protein
MLNGANLMNGVLSWLALIAMMGMMFAQTGMAAQPNDVVIRHNESNNVNISANTSGLRAQDHSVISQAPKIIGIGKGYYADHPINYNSSFGRQTWLKNRANGASMIHEVDSAHNLSQTLEMSARDIQRRDEWGIGGYSGIQMKVSEDVQEGRISIGVLKGGTSGAGMPPSATALRNPTLEIEEDYIGTFHIQKNISIQEPVRQIWQNYSWLPCRWIEYFDIQDTNLKNDNYEAIFDCKNEGRYF